MWDEVLQDIEFEYEECLPEVGLKVDVEDGEVEIEKWIMTDPPDDPDSYENWLVTPVLKISTTARLKDVLDPGGEHVRGSYLEVPWSLLGLIRMSPDKLQRMVVHAATLWLDYHGGSEEWVEAICE